MASLRYALALSCLALSGAQAQQMDMEAMQRWGSADLIRYHVVGIYQGTATVAPGSSGVADMTDRVVIDLQWKLSESKLVGTPVMQNSKTVIVKPHDREPSCSPPILKGEYEHYDLLGVKDGLGGALQLQGKTTYPVVEVAQFCTASRKTWPAKVDAHSEDLPVPSPMLIAMNAPATKELSVSADRKSLIYKRADWTWTFTPTPVKGK
jgi:hypothetical protein